MAETGKIGWFDLTVDDADEICKFYEQVTGWTRTEFDMGGYQDYCVHPAGSDDPVGGVCHRRGSNEGVPGQWMIYINVENLDESIAKCESLGGKIVCPKREMGGHGSMCVIEDPSGAVAALFQPST